jgi:hypothetical protein
MKWWAFLLAATMAVGLMSVGIARAQSDGLLPVTPGAGRYLPAAEALGDAWIETSRAGIAPGAELFREGVRGVYGGPEGTRALVYVWLTQAGETTRQGAWDTTAAFLVTRSQQWAADTSSLQVGAAITPAPLSGCTYLGRAEGVDPDSQIPGGLSLCAVDPDVIVLAIVSGEFDGASGLQASDALVQISLEAGSD